MNPDVHPPASDSASSPETTQVPPDTGARSTFAVDPASAAASLFAPSCPQRIGDYQILGELGRGGMGVVYKAYDLELKRLVALKMLWAGADASPDELIRFRGEAELVAQLQHPHIVQIYDIGQQDGRPYLALEFVEGGSLDKLTQGRPQPSGRAAETVETLARAIHVAHQQGIIHRDLKPANVLVARNGALKITDFGLAKRLDHSLGCSRTGDVMGTPSYMAPEQAEGNTRQVGPPTDVYALGVILYELLTGRPPFRGVHVLDTLEQVRQAEPARPSRLVPKLSRDLSTICLKCLHKLPVRRYPSAEALADDLRRWLDGSPIQARPVSLGERFWRAVRRRPLLAGLVATTLLMVAALVLVVVLTWEHAHQIAAQNRERAYRESLEQQYDQSLQALNAILDLVMEGGPLSKQPGLEPLHQKLLQYYGELVQQQEHNQLSKKDQLADACARLGDLIGKTGTKAEAIQAYAKAQQLYEDLTQDHSEQPEFRYQLAQTHLKKGMLHRDLGQLAQAETDYQVASAHLEPLCQQSPDHLQYKRQLAEVWHNRGVLWTTTRSPEEALAAYKQARELREELFRRRPNDRGYQRDLARSHGYIGDVELDLGQHVRADASYWASHRMRLRLADEDKNDAAEAQFQLARSWGNFGTYQTRVRALDTAIAFFEQARRIQEELVKNNATRTDYKSDLGSTYNRLVDLKMLKSVEGKRPQPELIAEVRDDLARALQTFGPLHQSDSQALGIRRGLAESHTLRAQLLLDSDRTAAVASLDAALSLLEVLCREYSDPGDLYCLATVQALASERFEGKEAPHSEAGERHRDAAEQALRQALDHGYRRKHPQDVEQQRAFRSLRTRPEFQNLLRRYERSFGAGSGNSQPAPGTGGS